jgi:hypothetical protein
LVHPAILPTLGADNLVELLDVEIDGRADAAAGGASSGVLLSASAVRMAVAILAASPCPPTCM